MAIDRKAKKVLVLGASYGLLISSFFLIRNFRVTIFCLDEERHAIDSRGICIGIPSGDTAGGYVNTEIPCENLDVVSNPSELIPMLEIFDVIFIAISESQMYASDICDVLLAANELEIPRVSLMNIPAPSFLVDRFDLEADALATAYTDHDLLSQLLPANLTMVCNPEPQVFRPRADANAVQIRLGGTFRICRSSSSRSNFVLDSLLQNASDCDSRISLPAVVRAYDSAFIGLSKLPMLMAGNYRCFDNNGTLTSICDAVMIDLERSEAIYESVLDLLRVMGARRSDLIPFRLYLRAARKLTAPSSICRSIWHKATSVERADILVQSLMKSYKCDAQLIDNIVLDIDKNLEVRRRLI